jgi:Phage integrase family
MPRPRLLFVQCQVTWHGRKVWYFRRNRSEPRVRLPDLYGSDEFTAAVVCLPILAPLRQALAASPKGQPEQLAFITLRRGANVGKEHLGAWFSEAAEQAGLVDCTAHGIRKAAARRLAEAGVTVNQLMAIFGWARLDMAIKYTREASKKHMAAEAIGGLVRNETENVYSLTTFLGEGIVAETGALSIS